MGRFYFSEHFGRVTIFCSKTKCGRFSCTKDKFSDSKYNYLRYSRSQMKQFRWLREIKKPKHPSLFRVFPIMEQITLKPMCFVAQTDQVLRGPRRPTEENSVTPVTQQNAGMKLMLFVYHSRTGHSSSHSKCQCNSLVLEHKVFVCCVGTISLHVGFKHGPVNGHISCHKNLTAWSSAATDQLPSCPSPK